MGVDLKKFHESIRHDFEFQGRRVRAFLKDHPDHEHDGIPTHPDVVAAAIAGTCIQHLEAYARHKFLSHKDIALAFEAFLKGTGMKLTETAMGGTVFERAEG